MQSKKTKTIIYEKDDDDEYVDLDEHDEHYEHDE